MPLNTENETPDVSPAESFENGIVTWEDIKNERRGSDKFYAFIAVVLLIVGCIFMFVAMAKEDEMAAINGCVVLLAASHFHIVTTIMRKIPTNHTIAILKILYEMYREQHTELQETEKNSAQDIDK